MRRGCAIIRAMETAQRITRNPEICGGKPCVSGTRISVGVILGLFAGGQNLEQVIATHPHLTAEDVSAALRYAADAVDRL